jgi:tetratricopeptide (TPR) repeat protein
MIRRPAALAGVHFESRPDTKEGLDQVLLNEAAASPESLPLLEFILDELYQRRTSQGVLTFGAYEELGGMAGALAGRAEAVFRDLSPTEQSAAIQEVFPALVSLDPTEGRTPARKYAAWETVTATPPRLALVEKFVAARLLIAARREGGGAVVSWAHDSLLWRWERLNKWIEANRELLRARGRLAAAAARWQAEPEKKRDLLLPEGKQLAEAREVLEAPGLDLTPEEKAFVRASLARARRGALIRRGAVVLLAVLTLIAGYQWRRAVLAQKAAESSAQTAEKARDLALQALNQVIFEVNDKLVKMPGTHLLRKKLLEDAARDLIGLSERLQSADRREDRSLGEAYTKIGDTLYYHLGQTAPAKEMYRKGLKLREQIVRQAPDNASARLDLSSSYGKLGVVSMVLGDLKGAKEYFEKSLELLGRLAQQDPDNAKIRREHSLSYYTLGEVSLRLVDLQGAREHFENSRKLREQLACQEPENLQSRRDLWASYIRLGDVNMKLGDLQAAGDYLAKALKLTEELAQQDPDNAQPRRDLSISYYRLGDLNVLLGGLRAAGDYYDKALKLREQLAQQDPLNTRAKWDLSLAYRGPGEVSMWLGDLRAARQYLEKSLQLLEYLAQQDPDNAKVRQDLALSYDKVGEVSMKSGDLRAAREYLEKSLNLREELARQAPESAEAALDLAVSSFKLGQVHRAAGQAPEAGTRFRLALEQLRRLEAQSKLLPAQKELVASVEQELNALPR